MHRLLQPLGFVGIILWRRVRYIRMHRTTLQSAPLMNCIISHVAASCSIVFCVTKQRNTKHCIPCPTFGASCPYLRGLLPLLLGPLAPTFGASCPLAWGLLRIGTSCPFIWGLLPLASAGASWPLGPLVHVPSGCVGKSAALIAVHHPYLRIVCVRERRTPLCVLSDVRVTAM